MQSLTKSDFITFKYSDCGEMLPYERYKLYNWVKDFKFKSVLEIGTGSGASTYFIAQALKENGEGTIMTCDPERVPPNDLLNDYDNIRFFKVTSDVLIDKIIEKNKKLDYIFFDGPEIPNLALDDLAKLEDYIEIGCYFSMHDWEYTQRPYDNGTSNKASMIRPYIENSDRWEKVEILSGLTVNSDYYIFEESNTDSVGFCLYRFVK